MLQTTTLLLVAALLPLASTHDGFTEGPEHRGEYVHGVHGHPSAEHHVHHDGTRGHTGPVSVECWDHPLCYAASSGNAREVQKALLAFPDEIHDRYEGRKTALHEAVQGHGTPRQKQAVVKALLEAGMDIDARAKDGHTAYEIARGHEVKHLLRDWPELKRKEKEMARKLRLGLRSKRPRKGPTVRDDL